MSSIVTPTRSSPLIPAAAGRPGDDPIFVLNAISPGTSRWYGAHYRDPDAVFCAAPTGSTFNSSSGLSVRWN